MSTVQVAARPAALPRSPSRRLLGRDWQLGYMMIAPVFLVIAGRANVTTRNFPAALAGLVANVILLLVLVPGLGIAGAAFVRRRRRKLV